MAFTNNTLKIIFNKITLLLKSHNFIELQFRAFRPWLYSDMIFSLLPQGRKQKKILKILHGFTEKVCNIKNLNLNPSNIYM